MFTLEDKIKKVRASKPESKVDDYLILATSSEGTIQMELQKILKGEYTNPLISIWTYKPDLVEEIPYQTYFSISNQI